jgi:predicted GIY-YIG superfamily endonuclease
MKTVFIYSLSTLEEPNNIRYIGKAKDLKKRLSKHVQPCQLQGNSHKVNWLKLVIKNGHTPIIKCIDIVDESEWKFWEVYWIEQFKVWGFDLTNSTSGGDGGLSKEQVEKIINHNFEQHSIRLKDDIEKFNVRKENGIWIAERICPQCHKTIICKRKRRSFCLDGIRTKQKDYKMVLCSNCQILKISKPVYMYSISGDLLKKFISASIVTRLININYKTISACCLHKQITTGGYKWSFKDDDTFEHHKK